MSQATNKLQFYTDRFVATRKDDPIGDYRRHLFGDKLPTTNTTSKKASPKKKPYPVRGGRRSSLRRKSSRKRRPTRRKH